MKVRCTQCHKVIVKIGYKVKGQSNFDMGLCDLCAAATGKYDDRGVRKSFTEKLKKST